MTLIDVSPASPSVLSKETDPSTIPAGRFPAVPPNPTVTVSESPVPFNETVI